MRPPSLRLLTGQFTIFQRVDYLGFPHDLLVMR
jgi:hypothetical protein